jgi:hypothetical protein
MTAAADCGLPSEVVRLHDFMLSLGITPKVIPGVFFNPGLSQLNRDRYHPEGLRHEHLPANICQVRYASSPVCFHLVCLYIKFHIPFSHPGENQQGITAFKKWANMGGIPDWTILGIVFQLAKCPTIHSDDAVWVRDKLIQAVDGKGQFLSPYNTKCPPPAFVEALLPWFAVKGKLESALGNCHLFTNLISNDSPRVYSALASIRKSIQISNRTVLEPKHVAKD